jgi:hypothetical protein
MDKVNSAPETIKAIESIIPAHPAAFPAIISTSAEKNLGMRDIQREIVSLL